MVRLSCVVFAIWSSYLPFAAAGEESFGGRKTYTLSYQPSDQDDESVDKSVDESVDESTLHWADDGPNSSDGGDIIVDDSPPQIYTVVVDSHASSGRFHNTPARMRAEFEPQSSLLISSRLAESAPNVLVDLTRATIGYVPLMILVNDDIELESVRRLLSEHDVAPTGKFLTIPHDTIWARDYGPIILSSRSNTIIVDAAYSDPERDCDDAVPGTVGELSNAVTRHTSLHLPGGNLLTNGRGICLTTTKLQDENPGQTQQEIVNEIANAYGASTIAILEPLSGESTGHVDMFATFTDPQTVLVGQYDSIADPENAAVLDRNAALLSLIRTKYGRLRIVRIPMPSRQDGNWPTFTNVVFANGRLFIPCYESTTMNQKMQIAKLYSRLLPEWDIRFIQADDLIGCGGALHCVVSNLGTLSIANFENARERATLSLVKRPRRYLVPSRF